MKAVLPVTPHIPNAVFREHFSDDYRFEVKILEARPTRVIDTRAYTRDDTGLAVVDSEWELDVNLFYRRRDADDSTLWQGWNDLQVTGTIPALPPTTGRPRRPSTDNRCTFAEQHDCVARPRRSISSHHAHARQTLRSLRSYRR